MHYTWADIYEYYFAGGLLCFILDNVASIIIGSVISCMPIFLFGCLKIVPIKNVVHISELILPLKEGFQRTNIFLKTCSFIFFGYNIFLLIRFLYNLPKFTRLHSYYKNTLGIPDRELSAILWNLVVEAVLIHEPEESRTALSIAQDIMRYENYLIALISDPSVLSWKTPFKEKRDHIPMSRFFFYILHLALYRTALDSNGSSIVNGTKAIQHTKSIQHLKTRFRLFGFLLLIFTPFIFAFQLLYLIFHYAQAIRNSPGTLSLRRWTPMSKWLIREYNELPHLLAERIRKSYLFANFYMDLFPSPLLQPIVRVGSFLSGTLLAILFIFGILTDSGFLLTIPILGDRTLAWIISIVASIYGICRIMIPNEERPFDPDEALDQVDKNIHFDFRDEKNTARSWAVYDKLDQFFQPMFMQLIMEMFSVVFNPFLFCIILPERAKSVVDFIEKNSVYDSEIGWICAFSKFDGNDKTIGQSIDQIEKLKRSMIYFNQSLCGPANLIDFSSSIIMPDESIPLLTRSEYSSLDLLNELVKDQSDSGASLPKSMNLQRESFVI